MPKIPKEAYLPLGRLPLLPLSLQYSTFLLLTSLAPCCANSAHSSPFPLRLDPSDQALEAKLDIRIGLCRCFEKLATYAHCQRFSLFRRDFSSIVVILLVANEYDRDSARARRLLAVGMIRLIWTAILVDWG
jgi:hypothetical protein